MNELREMTPQRRATFHDEQCRKHLQSATEHAWECGQALIEVKDILPHGDFRSWHEEAGISKDRAARYMRLARNYEKSQIATFGSVNEAIKSLSPKVTPLHDAMCEAVKNAVEWLDEWLPKTTIEDLPLVLTMVNDPSPERMACDIRLRAEREYKKLQKELRVSDEELARRCGSAA